MNEHRTNTPTIEAIVTTPVGTVRVWIDAEGTVRTGLNAELGSADDPGLKAQVLAVADQAARAVRAMLGCDGRAAAHPGALGEWFAERLTGEEGFRSPSMELYEDYTAWCAARRLSALSIRAFGDALGDRGVVAVKDRYGRKVRVGVRLRDKAGPAAVRVAG